MLGGLFRLLSSISCSRQILPDFRILNPPHNKQASKGSLFIMVGVLKFENKPLRIRWYLSATRYTTTCLDREVLQLTIRARCDIRADEPDYSTQSYRKAAYRQYTLWKYGKLGRGNRKIVPSCVVTTIRQAYPAPDGNYMGFRRS